MEFSKGGQIQDQHLSPNATVNQTRRQTQGSEKVEDRTEGNREPFPISCGCCTSTSVTKWGGTSLRVWDDSSQNNDWEPVSREQGWWGGGLEEWQVLSWSLGVFPKETFPPGCWAHFKLFHCSYGFSLLATCVYGRGGIVG